MKNVLGYVSSPHCLFFSFFLRRLGTHRRAACAAGARRLSEAFFAIVLARLARRLSEASFAMRAYTMLTFLAAVTATEDTLCVGPGGAYPPNYFDMKTSSSPRCSGTTLAAWALTQLNRRASAMQMSAPTSYNGEQIDLVVVNTSALYRTPLAAPHRRRTH